MASKTDWEAVEREYRAGQLSIREIARQHGVTDTGIRKKAHSEGWQRDLADRVRKSATEMLAQLDGAGSQEGSQGSSHLGSQRLREADAQTVLTAAQTRVEIVRQHRGIIGSGRDLTLRLVDELSTTTAHVGELEELIEQATQSDKTPQRRTAMLKAVSLPTRAGTIKDLSAAAKNWIALERQAFGLESGTFDDPATKADVRDALGSLNQSQRGQLRSLAEAVAGGPSGSASGT